jgi:hypothetical protein
MDDPSIQTFPISCTCLSCLSLTLHQSRLLFLFMYSYLIFHWHYDNLDHCSCLSAWISEDTSPASFHMEAVSRSKSEWRRPKGELSDREELERELCQLYQVWGCDAVGGNDRCAWDGDELAAGWAFVQCWVWRGVGVEGAWGFGRDSVEVVKLNREAEFVWCQKKGERTPVMRLHWFRQKDSNSDLDCCSVSERQDRDTE